MESPHFRDSVHHMYIVLFTSVWPAPPLFSSLLPLPPLQPPTFNPKGGQYCYGNYDKYYGYRNSGAFEDDPRLGLLKKEWFEGRDCLDIGCNTGQVRALLSGYLLGQSGESRACVAVLQSIVLTNVHIVLLEFCMPTVVALFFVLPLGDHPHRPGLPSKTDGGHRH